MAGLPPKGPLTQSETKGGKKNYDNGDYDDDDDDDDDYDYYDDDNNDYDVFFFFILKDLKQVW